VDVVTWSTVLGPTVGVLFYYRNALGLNINGVINFVQYLLISMYIFFTGVSHVAMLFLLSNYVGLLLFFFGPSLRQWAMKLGTSIYHIYVYIYQDALMNIHGQIDISYTPEWPAGTSESNERPFPGPNLRGLLLISWGSLLLLDFAQIFLWVFTQSTIGAFASAEGMMACVFIVAVLQLTFA
jgi:hypothetical protein